MDDVKKLFQKIVNGQSAMKQELLSEIKKVRNEVRSHRKETQHQFKEVQKRLDKQGKSLAYLEDDAPTIEEFDKLEKRVAKVEKKAQASVSASA